MKLKIALSTATAIGLLALTGAAWAGDSNTAVVIQGLSGLKNSASVDQSAGDNNITKLTQDGKRNSAVVTQDGSRNWVGTHLQSGPASYDPSETARGYNYVTQSGDRNDLSVLQTGNGNLVGYDGHVLQSGDRNVIDITQHGGASQGARVNTVEQTGLAGATATTNKLVVLQQGGLPDYSDGVHYANESIGTVKQTNTGGALNKLTLTQKGGNFTSPPQNNIQSAVQNGFANQGDVSQVGRNNLLASLSQTGSANRASIAVKGQNNGNGPLTLGAAASGASTSTVTQDGIGNEVDYSATGDDNQFGFYQHGGPNYATGITILGNGNELGVYQDGTNNTLSLAAITDDDNLFGVRQVGSDNTASISSSGGQNGGHNDFTHSALDPNSTPAGTLASAHGLTAGLLEQNGIHQQVSLTISGGSGNVFASLQGDSSSDHDNRITATQSGSGNEAAVAQLGSSNVATLNQTGGQNNASISQ